MNILYRLSDALQYCCDRAAQWQEELDLPAHKNMGLLLSCGTYCSLFIGKGCCSP